MSCSQTSMRRGSQASAPVNKTTLTWVLGGCFFQEKGHRVDTGCGESAILAVTAQWALNSAVECHLHTVEVIGSNPIAPTIF